MVPVTEISNRIFKETYMNPNKKIFFALGALIVIILLVFVFTKSCGNPGTKEENQNVSSSTDDTSKNEDNTINSNGQEGELIIVKPEKEEPSGSENENSETINSENNVGQNIVTTEEPSDTADNTNAESDEPKTNDETSEEPTSTELATESNTSENNVGTMDSDDVVNPGTEVELPFVPVS